MESLSRKRKRRSEMWVKRLSILLVVLLVASSFVWALPGAKKTTEVKVAAQPEPETSTSVDSSKLTESEASEISTSLTELLNLLENKSALWGTQIEAVKDAAKDVSYDVTMSNALNLTLTEQVDSLKKELNKTRFFVDFGVAFGFKEKAITYGAVADMGMKFGKGFIVKTGVQYMVGDFSDIKNVSWSLDNLTVSATVGWEW